jgi:hypothetical protein
MAKKIMVKRRKKQAPALSTMVATQRAARSAASETERPCRFKKPLWDFWEDGCTQSLIRVWAQCMEQARLKYVEGWSRRGNSLPLEFGSCVHWVLSQISGTAKKPPGKRKILNTLDAYEKLWKEQAGIRTQKSDVDFERVLGLAQALLPRYVERWAGDWTGKYKPSNPTVAPKKWLQLEGRFKVPFVLDDGAQTYLQGMFDGVFEDKKGRLWLFETKTKSVIEREIIEDTLQFDIQVLLYLWALKQVYKRTPHGVLYNVIRRPGLRQGKQEKLNDFFERCRMDVEDPKRTDHYFIRWELEVEESEIDAFEHDYLRPILGQMRRWWDGSGPHFMNPDALMCKYGKADMYEPIVHGNFRSLKKRKVVFPELADSAL